jgi:polysaccharide export outer membrane protein
MMKKRLAAVISSVFFLSLLMAPAAVSAQGNTLPVPAPDVKSEIAADSDTYIIGPEDVLFIHVWKEEGLTKTVTVRMDGKISLPLVDEITAEGLTPLKLKEVLIKKLTGFVDNPVVSVMVMEANSFKVYVTGEVRNPGVQRIRSEVTLIKLMAMAGGFTEWANRKKILIIRKEQGKDRRIIVNYNNMIDGQDPDIVIHRGDTIVVQ